MKRHADFERPALAHAATPASPLTSTHRICLDSGIMFTLCSHRQVVHQTPDVQSHRRGMMRLRSVNWGEGDELPNCFLERSRLGRSLPCAIRLRAQRSDHMAVVCVARLTPARLGVCRLSHADKSRRSSLVDVTPRVWRPRQGPTIPNVRNDAPMRLLSRNPHTKGAKNCSSTSSVVCINAAPL